MHENNNMKDIYDEVVVLCGGNYNRAHLVDVSNKIDCDKDIMKVIRFKNYYLLFYVIFFVSAILSSLFAILELVSEFVQTCTLIHLLGTIGINLKDLTVAFACISLCSYLFDLITRITQNANLKKALAVILADNKTNYSDLEKKDKKNIIRMFNRALRHKKMPKSPNMWWRTQQGHISDAQIFKFINQSFPDAAKCKETNDVYLVFSGTPYYYNEFVDSIYIKVRYDKAGSSVYLRKSRIDKLLKQTLERHKISYHIGNAITESKHDNSAQLNTSQFVFGILYLSKSLKAIYDFCNEKYGHKNCSENKFKIRIDLNDEFIGTGKNYKKVVDFLFKAATTMDYYYFDSSSDTGPVIEVVDISMINEKTEVSNKNKGIRKSCLRIPIKRPVSLPSAVYIDKFGMDKKRLIIGTGGAEQNDGVLHYLVENLWKDGATKELGINENCFLEKKYNILFGCENLVHAVYGIFSNQIIDRQKEHKEKRYVFGFVYKVENVEENTDMVGIYGFDALSTKLLTLLFAYCNFTENALSTTKVVANLAPNLYIVREKGLPDEDFNADKVRDLWDRKDFVNNISQIEELINVIDVIKVDKITKGISKMLEGTG